MKEAETEGDQLRLRGMGIQWQPNATTHHGSDLMEYFQTLDAQKNEPANTKGLARAVGSRVIRER